MFDMEEFLIRIRKGGDDAINALREYLAELAIEVHSIDATNLYVVPQRWIPVSERLPDPFVQVLVFDYAEKMICIGQREHHRWYFYGSNEMGEPTHWMSLPAAPPH